MEAEEKEIVSTEAQYLPNIQKNASSRTICSYKALTRDMK